MLLSEKIKNDLEEELKLLEKIFNENCELEEKNGERSCAKDS